MYVEKKCNIKTSENIQYLTKKNVRYSDNIVILIFSFTKNMAEGLA